MVTGSADQTIRLWNLKTRELIVSRCSSPARNSSIWMPQGYYYSSDEGDKLIGWHVNQGRDKEGRFIRAGQLKKYLWSPEMVRRAIILKSARQAAAGNAAGRRQRAAAAARAQAAGIRRASSPRTRRACRDGFVAVEIIGAEEAGTDVSDFSILSNSRNVGDFASRSISGDGKKTMIQVPVDDGQNQITITGVNEYGYLTERSVVAIAKKSRPRRQEGQALRRWWSAPRNIRCCKTDCSGRPCDLRYPVDDAAELLRVLSEKSAPLYTGLEALVLVNREVARRDARARRRPSAKIAGIDAVLEPESDNIGDQIADFLDKPDRRRHDDRLRRRPRHQHRRGLLFHPLRRPQIGPRQVEALVAGRVGRHPEGGRARRRRPLHAARHLPRRQRLQPAAREGRGRCAHRRVFGDRRQQHGRRAARTRARRLHLYGAGRAARRGQHRRRRRAGCSGSPTTSIAR